DDWIELHNTTDVPVDLTGHYLSDDPTTPHKWRVPDGVVIAPDGYLTVWADEDGGASPGLHASFKLAGGGESILLVASEEQGGAALDSVAYGEQTVDVSFGRMPNGVGEFGPMAASPGRANAGE
ncbi:lamin tail domain-containing protein, partial [Candidatus Poribacteria bacterium]|nr:lamin tail domain-containing protein [Candidatus Poribacteria bacterium]